MSYILKMCILSLNLSGYIVNIYILWSVLLFLREQLGNDNRSFDSIIQDIYMYTIPSLMLQLPILVVSAIKGKQRIKEQKKSLEN